LSSKASKYADEERQEVGMGKKLAEGIRRLKTDLYNKTSFSSARLRQRV